jgi:hypothetical protein
VGSDGAAAGAEDRSGKDSGTIARTLGKDGAGGENPSGGDGGDGANGSSGATVGGDGGTGGRGGRGGDGAGGSFALQASWIASSTADIGAGGAGDAGDGRLILVDNVGPQHQGPLEGALETFTDGPLRSNPLIEAGPATPYIPDLQEGPEVFGLLADVTVHDLPSVLAAAPAQASLAVARMDVGPGSEPIDFEGFDFLLLVNMCSQALQEPMLGVGAAGASALPLGGPATNAEVGGEVPLGVYSALPAERIYATTIPEGPVQVQYGYDATLFNTVMANCDVEYVIDPEVPVECLPEPGAEALAVSALVAVAALSRMRRRGVTG